MQLNAVCAKRFQYMPDPFRDQRRIFSVYIKEASVWIRKVIAIAAMIPADITGTANAVIHTDPPD